MSYTSPSAEVAEDFAIALEALNLNNRYEISNLTVIAKENTEHAFAISEALKNHIKQVGALIRTELFEHNHHTRATSNFSFYVYGSWFTLVN